MNQSTLKLVSKRYIQCLFSTIMLTLLFTCSFAQSKVRMNSTLPWDVDQLKEIVSLRSQHAKHFQNLNGTNTMFTSPASLHYQQDKQWQEIDVAIDANNTDTKIEYPFCNTANQFKTYYPSNPFDGNVLTKLKEGIMTEHIESVFARNEQGEKVYSFPTSSHIIPSLNQSQIVYQQVIHGMDIRYTQEADGRKFDLILNQKTCLDALPSNARWLVIQEQLSLPLGWTITSDNNGIEIYAGKKWMANFPSPIAFEQNSSTRKDDDGMKEGDIHFFKRGNDIFIETSFSVDWLRHPDRNFPVTLDPVTSYYPANLAMTTGNMTSSSAAKVSGNIRQAASGAIAWAQFDLSGLPTFANISSATYWGFHFNGTSIPSKISAIVGLQTVNPISATNTSIYNQINSSGPIYNNNYLFGGATVAQWNSGAINSNGINDINSQIAQGWTALGFKYLSGATNTSFQHGYNVANSAYRPYLEITYTTTPCAGAPSASTATSSISSSCGLPFMLDLLGTGSESGYMYQWQSSPTGINAWINIGSSSATKSLSTSQTVATDYQCIVTCTNSGLSTTSSIVTVGQSPTISNSSSLTSCNSYVFGGTTYTTSGIYTHTFLNPGGCDSIHTLSLTINHNSTPSSFSASNCGSYTWVGITYTISGVYTRTFVNAGGCDSIRTLNLTILLNNSPLSAKAFIVNQGSNNVMVFNLANNNLMATIPVGAMPQEIAIHPDKSKVYIGNWNGASISVINTANNTVSSTIAMGVSDRPDGLCMSPDGTKLYVLNAGINPSSVKVYNTANNTLITSITVGNNARAIAISPDGSKVYVANSTSNTISVIITASNTVAGNISVGNVPEGLAMSPDGSKLYVALRTAGSVQVINTSTNTIVNAITVGTQPIGIAVHPNGSKLYVANSVSNNISVINTTSNTVTNTITAGTTPSGISFNQSGSKMYVCNYSSGTVSIFNTSNDLLSGTMTAGSGPYSYGNFIMTYPDSPQVANVCNSYTWLGNTYTQSGTYTFSQTNSIGCDSITTLNLTVRHSTSGSTTANGAYSYTIGSSTFYTTGIYTLTFTNSQGCDSIHTLNLTMTANSGSSVVSTCNSYTWNGTTYTTSGNYTGTFMNVAGYDSIHTLHLSINNNTPNIQRAYVPNYNSNNVSVINLLNNSIIATIPVGTGPSTIEVSPDGNKVYVGNFTSNTISVINTSTNTVIKTVALSNTPYQLKTTPDGSKILISTINIPMLSMNTSTYSVTTAFTATSPVGDFTFSPDESKLYVCFYTFGNSKINVYNANNYALISSYAIGASRPVSITSSDDGTKLYVINSTNSGPCTVQVFNSANGSLLNTIQTGQNSSRLALYSGGNKLYVSNQGENTVSVINTITNTVIQTINVGSTPNALSFNNSYSKLFVCNEGSNNVSVINTSTDAISNTISVGSGPRGYGNFIPVMSGVFTTDACNSFTWNGSTYTNTGIYTHTATNALGCDSVSTLNLTIKHSSTGNTIVASCNSYTLGSTTYTNSGVYVATLVNAEGCDSLVNLTLTINHTNTASSTVSTCSSYLFGGTTYTTSGTYIAHFLNASGCDSMHTLTLIINSIINVSSYVHACNSYTWNGSTLTASGVYTASFSTPGCDSTHKLTLELDRNSPMEPRAFIPNLSTNSVTVVNLVTNQVITTIPVGASPSAVAFSPNKNRVYVTNSSAGTVSVILTSTNTVIATVALGSSSNIKGIVVSNDGSKVFVAHNATPAKISVINAANFTVSTTISLSSQVNALCMSPDGTKLYAQTTNGSVIYVINTTTYAITNITLSSFSASNMVINATGTKLHLIGSSNVVASYNLLTNTATYLSLPSEGYPMSAIAISPDGTKLYVGKGGGFRIAIVNTTTNTLTSTAFIGVWPYALSTNADGSKLYIVTTNLLTMTFSPTIISNTVLVGGLPQCVSSFVGAGPAPIPSVSACNSYTWFGNTYTTSGLYAQTYTNAAGCDSLNSLQINLSYPAPPVNSSLTVCDSYTFGGITYTASGVYTDTFISSYGCDSIHILNLTVTHPVPVVSNVSACSSYLFAGTTYTLSGIYSHTFIGSNNCDSIHTIQLTIYNTTSSDTSVEVCQTYTWNSQTFLTGGVYSFTFTNAQGCDSVATLHLSTTEKLPRAYIPNYGSNNVSVVDLNNNTIIATIAVGISPRAVAVSPDGNRVYVSNAGSANMSVIDTKTNTVIATIPIGNNVSQAVVSHDNSKVYVSCIGSGNITIVNAITNTVISSFSAGFAPNTLCLSPDGNRLYVTTRYSHLLTAYNTTNNSVIASVPVGTEPDGIAISPDGLKVYVSNYLSQNVSIVNTNNFSVYTTPQVFNFPVGLCLNADGSKLYVANTSLASGGVIILNTQDYSTSPNIVTGSAPYGIALNADGTKLYVSNSASNNVSVLSTASNTLLANILVNSTPYAMGNFISNGKVVSVNACGAYTWNGVTYSVNGHYTNSATSAIGCDSTTELYLIVRPITVDSFNVSTCGSYQWYGNTYTTSGLYSLSFTNAVGCDSLKILNLQINTVDSINLVTNACDSYQWNGTTYTSSGTYTSTFTNQASCDSIVTLQLTINASSNSSSSVTASNLYTWPVNGVTYTSSGVYTFTYQNSVGCVHTATLNLIITSTSLSSVIAFEDQTVSCHGFNDGSCQTTALPNGNYTYELDGGTHSNNTGFFDGLIPGVHTVCVTDGINTICDTVFIHEPAALNILFNVDSLVSCHGHDGGLSAIISGGTNVLQGYVTTWRDASNNILNPVPANFNHFVGGLDTGVYSLMIEDDHGCFLTQSTSLGSAPPLVVTGNYTNILCHGGSSVISPAASGGSGNIIISINGLAIQPSYPAGTYTITAVDERACSASAIININEPASTNTSTTVSSCDQYTWVENGTTYTTSGIYTHSTTNGIGCVGIATLNLTIFNSHHVNSTITAINTYTWPVNGNTYTSSGTYTASYLNQHGCDSVYTLHLTITGIAISPKVYLGGAYDQNTGLMYDSLRTKNLIPLLEPYSNPPYFKPQIGGPGGETTNTAVLALNGMNAIVDWVFIEIRSAVNPSILVATRRALLQRDGDVVDVDGMSIIYLQNIPQGNYYVSIKHRNHLGVMTASILNLNSSTTVIDFTSSIPVYSVASMIYNSPRKLINGVYVLWAGDANNNKNVKYNGLGNDKDVILNAVGMGTSNNILTAYRTEDVNMDGHVKYNNVNNDKNFILTQIGINTPNTVYSQHTTD